MINSRRHANILTSTISFLAKCLLMTLLINNLSFANTTSFTSNQLKRTVALTPVVFTSKNQAPQLPASIRFIKENGLIDATTANVEAASCNQNALTSSLSGNVSFGTATQYTSLQKIGVELSDVDENTNSQIKESVMVELSVQGDIESIELKETGINSGIFVGFLSLTDQNLVQYNCQLSKTNSGEISAVYQDKDQATDRVETSALIIDGTQQLFISQQSLKNQLSTGQSAIVEGLIFNRSDNLSANNQNLNITLSNGLSINKNSLIINGQIADFDIINGEIVANINSLAPLQELPFSYSISAHANPQQQYQSTARIADDNEQQTSNKSATQWFWQNLMSNAGATVRGRVTNQNNQPVANVHIYTDKGQKAITNQWGYYQFIGLLGKQNLIRLDHHNLPTGVSASLQQSLLPLKQNQISLVNFKVEQQNNRFEINEEPIYIPKTAQFLSQQNSIVNQLSIDVGERPLEGIELVVNLPEGVEYVTDSARINFQPVIEPQIKDQQLIFTLGDAGAHHQAKFQFETKPAETTYELSYQQNNLQLNYKKAHDPAWYKAKAPLSRFTTVNGEPLWSKTKAPETIKLGFLDLNDQESIVEAVQSIRVKLPANLTPKLLLNDKPISNEKIGFEAIDADKKSKIITYFGIEFTNTGEHQLILQGVGPFGNVRFENQITVIKTGSLHRIELTPLENKADGQSPIQIQINGFDENNYPINSQFRIAVNSHQLIPVDNTIASKTTQQNNQYGLVEKNILSFLPVDQAGTYKGALLVNNETVPFSIEVAPSQREWMLVALTQGSISQADINRTTNNVLNNNQGTFYAQGSLNKNWLLTLGANTDLNKEQQALLADQDAFSLWSSNPQTWQSPSDGPLYLRLESKHWHLMYGLLQHEINHEFMQTSVQWQGFLATVKKGKMALTTALTQSALQNIEQQWNLADGFGPYSLLYKPALGSLQVKVVTYDRNSEEQINQQTLNPFIDYQLNEQAVFVKLPMVATDSQLNPKKLIITYKTENEISTNKVYGLIDGDVQLSKSINVGATLLSLDKLYTNARLSIKDEQNSLYVDLKNDGEKNAGSVKLAKDVKKHSFEISLGSQKQISLAEAIKENPWANGQWQWQVNENNQWLNEYSWDNDQSVFSSKWIYKDQYIGLKATQKNDEQLNALLLGSKFTVNKKTTMNVASELSKQSQQISMGLDYKINPDLTIGLMSEINKAEQTFWQNRISLISTPWSGAQFKSVSETKTGEPTRQILALNQTVQLSESLSLTGEIQNGFYQDNTLPAFWQLASSATYHAGHWQHIAAFNLHDQQNQRSWKIGLDSNFAQQETQLWSIKQALQNDDQYLLSAQTAKTNLDWAYYLTSTYEKTANDWLWLNKLQWVRQKSDWQWHLNAANLDTKQYDISTNNQLLGSQINWRYQQPFGFGLDLYLLQSSVSDSLLHSYGPKVQYRHDENVAIELGYHIEGFEARSMEHLAEQGWYINWAVALNEMNARSLWQRFLKN